MVPRNYPGQNRARRQMHWSTETIFRVLEAHEPDHPLLEEAYRQASQIFLDADEANAFLDRVQHFNWQLRELPAVSPFSFPIYASKIKETMMLEDPAVAVERIYRELYARVRQVTLTNENRSEEHTSELQSRPHLVCRLLLATPTTQIYTLSLHDALPISRPRATLQLAVARAAGGLAIFLPDLC